MQGLALSDSERASLCGLIERTISDLTGYDVSEEDTRARLRESDESPYIQQLASVYAKIA